MILIHNSDTAELVQTNYPHPTITTGQHTNGPARVWIRRPASDWIDTGETSLHRVVQRWNERGWAAFEETAATSLDRTDAAR